MNCIHYRLADGRVWSVEDACFIDPDAIPEGSEILFLKNADGVSDAAYLARTLAFYGEETGELTTLSADAIRAKLENLDAKYLTPRTMAGIGVSDPEALQRWRLHEEECQPLREALARLEA